MFSSVRKQLKSIYKKIIEGIFALIYPKPKLKQKDKDYSEKIIKIKLDKNSYKLFEFIQGRIFTDGNDTTAYISKNN